LADNRITAAPGETYTYDNEGNVISMITSIGVGSKSFQWDHRNRLIQSTVNTSSGIMTVNYAYDPFNRLVKRSDVFNTTYFGYDEGINPQLQMETQSGNQITHRYLWSDQVDELFADEQRLSGLVPDTKWALSDHQGTIKDIADFNSSTGQTTVRHRAYDSFGNRKGSALTTDIVFGYTGKYFDETTGLQNSWNRWYSPKMGRFISQDPIGFAAGDANLYRYVGNGPTMATDPSGLKTNWHHLLPQSSSLRKYFDNAGINVHDAAYGWLLDSAYHTQDAKNLHNSGWNDEWKKFFDNNPGANKAAILDQLDKMKGSSKYDNFLKNGKQAAMSYNDWQKLLSKQRRLAAKAAKALAKNSSTLAKAGKVGRKGGKLVKVIPGVATIAAVASWGVDGYCKGPVYGTVNTGIDAIPIVGNVKCIVELFTGDFIPDYEEPSDPSDELTAEEQAWIQEYGEPDLEEMIDSE
jgi:RHS repeat-associated protein